MKPNNTATKGPKRKPTTTNHFYVEVNKLSGLLQESKLKVNTIYAPILKDYHRIKQGLDAQSERGNFVESTPKQGDGVMNTEKRVELKKDSQKKYSKIDHVLAIRKKREENVSTQIREEDRASDIVPIETQIPLPNEEIEQQIEPLTENPIENENQTTTTPATKPVITKNWRQNLKSIASEKQKNRSQRKLGKAAAIRIIQHAFWTWKKYKTLHFAAIKIQRCWRRYKKIKNNRAAVAIQKVWRGFSTKKNYAKKVEDLRKQKRAVEFHVVAIKRKYLNRWLEYCYKVERWREKMYKTEKMWGKSGSSNFHITQSGFNALEIIEQEGKYAMAKENHRLRMKVMAFVLWCYFTAGLNQKP